MKEKTKAVVLLSGGLDSAVVLAVAVAMGFEAHALTFRYGQRHCLEIEAARAVAAAAGVAEHKIVNIGPEAFRGSALTDGVQTPKGRSDEEMKSGVPVTYVPARNTIFLSYALGWAEVMAASDIFIGVNALDYSGYPDCRPEFIAAFQAMADLATKAAVEGGRKTTIHAPLINLTKGQIITKGLALGVDYGLTLSCYDPGPGPGAVPCGECDACRLRRKGFVEAGLIDPATAVRMS